MQERSVAHERVRFRRDDISDLDRLPSAVAAVPVATPRRSRLRLRSALFPLFGVVCVALAVFFLFPMGGETLRLQAERALSDMLGRPVAVSIGATRLALGADSLIAVRLDDARLSAEDGGTKILDAGHIAFAIHPFPLLRGTLTLGSATISDARIDLSDQPADAADRLALFRDERGLIDADRLGKELFGLMHRLFDTLERGATDSLQLRNVELLFSDEPGAGLLVETASLQHPAGQGVEIEATLVFAGRNLRLRGSADRSAAAGPISDLRVSLTMDPPGQSSDSPLDRHVNAVELAISGSEDADGFGRLAMTVRATDAVFGPGHPEQALFDVELRGYIEPGLGKLEISSLSIGKERSRWRFHGAVGPTPQDMAAGYRFELVSDGSRVAPQGSLEPPIDVLARLGGRISEDGGLVAIDEIALRTADGQVNGSALVTIEPGITPGLDLDIVVADFPVGSAKQLWPWFAAPEAREWTHQNLFGGRVLLGRVEVSVAPGRLADRRPLETGEISGEFQVERVRFDVAGRIPPIREGIGRVAFEGSEIDVTLESGTIYLPSGRTVQAARGSFDVDAARGKALVGALDIDVSGDAAAILELASYDPIDAGSHIDFVPADFEGAVSGNIVADIPLQEGIDLDSLPWMVVLEYQDLAVAKPINDYLVSGANGSILIEPGRVVIDAETLLDGLPARVYLVEPLGDAAGERVQEVSLTLDDAARDRFMPGLAAFLSGGAEVEMESGGGARQEIGVDLVNSRLTVPWAGWSKGAGIPARASFVMENSEARTVLDDFALEGETFAVRGSLALQDGQLEDARFHNVRFNRGDDFAVEIDRSGGGYAVEISGRSLDARSLIKHLTSDADPGGEPVEGVPVSVELRLDKVDGFHQETLHDVRLRYRGTGSTIETLILSATTSGDQAVHFRHETVAGVRNVTMQSNDAGALVRFLDIYDRMEGGRLELAISGPTDGPLSGTVDARDFWVVDEPRLGSMVTSAPVGGNQSLNQALRSQIDVSRVRFDRGFAQIGKGPGYLSVERGLLRSPDIGTTFRGMLYDAEGRMDMSGTFMPAYGLNRLFGEIPLVGQILGNGDDGGLIGVTYRLAGEAGEPQLQINPFSAVAPGIFRSVFEYN